MHDILLNVQLQLSGPYIGYFQDVVSLILTGGQKYLRTIVMMMMIITIIMIMIVMMMMMMMMMIIIMMVIIITTLSIMYKLHTVKPVIGNIESTILLVTKITGTIILLMMLIWAKQAHMVLLHEQNIKRVKTVLKHK